MKKILALVLALVLTLTAAAALAGPSTESGEQKTNGTNYNYSAGVDTTVETETKLTSIKDTDATNAIKDELKDAANNNTLAEVLPLEGEYTEVNEMITIKIPDGSIYKAFKVAVQTPYKVNEKVQVLIGVPQDDGTTLWISVDGIVNDKNEIVFTLSDADYNKVAGKEVVIVPASKPAK